MEIHTMSCCVGFELVHHHVCHFCPKASHMVSLNVLGTGNPLCCYDAMGNVVCVVGAQGSEKLQPVTLLATVLTH